MIQKASSLPSSSSGGSFQNINKVADKYNFKSSTERKLLQLFQSKEGVEYLNKTTNVMSYGMDDDDGGNVATMVDNPTTMKNKKLKVKLTTAAEDAEEANDSEGDTLTTDEEGIQLVYSDDDDDDETNDKYDELKYSELGHFYEDGTPVEQYNDDGSPTEHGYDEEEDIDEETVGHYMFDEDGTLLPTLGLLKEWTLEYFDAVDLAGGGLTRISIGVESLMSSYYVFTSPTIGPINKEDFKNLMTYYRDNGLDLSSAIPDLKAQYEGWHVDPHDPWRVWVVVRYTGTHTGTAYLPDSGLMLAPSSSSAATGEPGQSFATGPELQSFLWTSEKQILWQTMGYVGDGHTGSNQGHGGLEGLLVSMGLPHLYLEATSAVRDVSNWFSQFKTDKEKPRAKSPYSELPQWWHERKSFDLNVQR